MKQEENTDKFIEPNLETEESDLEPKIPIYEELTVEQKKAARNMVYFTFIFFISSLWYALFFGLIPFIFAIFKGNYELGSSSGSTMIQASVLALAARVGLTIHKQQFVLFAVYFEKNRKMYTLHASFLFFCFLILSIIALNTGYYNFSAHDKKIIPTGFS